ncbi:MAG TPA: SPW repeat protein [Candidatus Saccharimonadales bacterium]|nr:SPW repeat protein [Candidatus Saccharimonadales bacterium]
MDSTTKNTSQTLSVLIFLFGIWLIISPYILNYVAAQAIWQQTVAGIIIAILAAVRLAMPRQTWASWVNAVLGAWMIIAPFATGYQTSAEHWNEVVFGILVLIGALWNASLSPSSTVIHRRGGPQAAH